MKTVKELEKLSMAIGEAVLNYRKAVEANIKESGKELEVVGYDYDDEACGIVLKLRDDDAVDTARVDKVRWNNEIESVEYHCSEWNYKEEDTWSPIYWLGDEQDYVYENINWE